MSASYPVAQPIEAGLTPEHSRSAVSWAAIFAGGVTACAVTIVLAALGAGLGFTTLSPWPGQGSSAVSFTIKAGIALIVVQWISSLVGGYIAGRLRTKWVGVHTHEVFFRDTAHGFLAWAAATVLVVSLVASAGSSAVGTGVRAVGSAAGGLAQGAGSAASTVLASQGYDVDALLRGTKPDLAGSNQAVTGEVGRILANSVTRGELPAADRTYLAQLIADRTGVSPADAQKRVDDTVASIKAAQDKAREAADTARKSAAAVSLFTALSMLIGAFIASAAAAYGGSLRDETA